MKPIVISNQAELLAIKVTLEIFGLKEGKDYTMEKMGVKKKC